MTGRGIRPARRVSQRSIKLAGEAADKAGLTWGDVADMPGCGTRMPSPTGSGRARAAARRCDAGAALGGAMGKKP